ncbi:MAG: hypothetical protein MHPSP_000848 [Paramarteilia canceri]
MDSSSQQNSFAGFLIDGFPRNMDNLNCWEKELTGSADVVGCLFLDIPSEVSLKRCLRRAELARKSNNEQEVRDEDNEKTIRLRIKKQGENLKPVLNAFESKKMLKVVDSNCPIPEMIEKVDVILKELLDI